MKRPAETAAAGATGLPLLALLLGAPEGVVAAAGVAVGLIPAAVTWLVSNGGVRGVASSLWRGKEV